MQNQAASRSRAIAVSPEPEPVGGLRPGARPFAHLDVPLAPLYRRVMAVFIAAKQRFVVHLRPEDVVEAMRRDAASDPVTQEQVDEALRSLECWGNLRADPDTGRVTTVEDFYRARYLYQLSREGEAAERALALYETELGRRGELQAVALEDIRFRLRALHELEDNPDPAVVHNLLLELMGRLDSLPRLQRPADQLPGAVRLRTRGQGIRDRADAPSAGDRRHQPGRDTAQARGRARGRRRRSR